MRRLLTLMAVLWSVTGLTAASNGGELSSEGQEQVNAPCPQISNDTVIVLVGHGIPPIDFPKDRLQRFFRLSVTQHSHGGAHGHSHHHHHEEAEEYRRLEEEIRNWPRTAENDPYKTGVERVASVLSDRTGHLVLIGFNEFCAPTTEQAIREAIRSGAKQVLVTTVMLTPGGNHSELDILHSVQRASMDNPDIDITYAWPIDVDLIAGLLSEHLAGYGVEAEAVAMAEPLHNAAPSTDKSDHHDHEHPHEH